jgi:replicative DNA helicase
MSKLSDRSIAIDPVTVRDELTNTGDLDIVGGPAYIASLLDGVPHSAHIEHYAQIVKQKSIRRALIQVSERIMESAWEGGESVEAVLDESERLVFSIAQQNLRGGFVPMNIIAAEGLKAIERLQEHRGNITGLASGYGALDEKTSGFQPSDLIILAARPSMGKTSLAINIAHNAALNDKKVGIFSLEMSREQLFFRLLTGQARIDAHAMRTGRLKKEEWARAMSEVAALAETSLFIDDTAGSGIMEMRAKSRRLKKEQGLDLIVIDYLQLIRSRGRFENRNQEITEISRSLKELAKELNIPIIALSQLSRAPEQRSEKGHRPQLSDLRESGAIEQDADVVMFIYREEVYKPTEENRGLAELIIAKQRNGPTDTVHFAFLREYTRFEQREWRAE